MSEALNKNGFEVVFLCDTVKDESGESCDRNVDLRIKSSYLWSVLVCPPLYNPL